MSLNCLEKGIYDELYVAEGSSLTRMDGNNSLQTDVGQLQSDVIALQNSKQDTITALSVVNTTQLLNNNIMRPLKQASGNTSLITDMDIHNSITCSTWYR